MKFTLHLFYFPLRCFQAEPSVKRHFLRKWLKDSSITADVDLRSILDWDYYLERLGSTIQKIITIPAALQQVPNPVPRVAHPDWLHKRMNKAETCTQRKITDIFKPAPDIEDGFGGCATKPNHLPIRITKKRPSSVLQPPPGPPKPWREVLGAPPRLEDVGTLAWLEFHQKKWKLQAERRKWIGEGGISSGPLAKRIRGLGGFLTRTRAALSQCIWQVSCLYYFFHVFIIIIIFNKSFVHLNCL